MNNHMNKQMQTEYKEIVAKVVGNTAVCVMGASVYRRQATEAEIKGQSSKALDIMGSDYN